MEVKENVTNETITLDNKTLTLEQAKDLLQKLHNFCVKCDTQRIQLEELRK